MNRNFPSQSGFSILKFLLGTVLFLIVAVLVFLTFFLSPTAKWFANSQLSEILGTEASVEDISIKLWSGDLEVKNVHIADPAGGEDSPPLFSLGRLFIDINAKSVFSDVVVIEEITIEAPEVHASRDGSGKFSFEDLKVMQPSEEPEQPEESSEGAGLSKGIQINKITLTKLAGSFDDQADPQATNSYTIKDLAFHSKTITLNLGNVIKELPTGIRFEELALSDAEFDYTTNRIIPDPDATQSAPAEQGSSETTTQTSSEEPNSTEVADSTAASEPAEPKSQPTPEDVPADPVDPIFISKLTVDNFRIHYLDQPANSKKKELDLNLRDIFLNASDIAYDPLGLLKQTQDTVLNAKMGFKIDQKSENESPAVFTAVAKSTIIGDDLPITAGSVQLTGFELATVKSLVPTGTQSAIGGPGLDLFAKWFMSPDELAGNIKITSSANVVTKVTISGTPDSPKISGGEMLMNVIGRPGQLLGNLAGNAFKGSLDIVSGAGDAAGSLVKGAGNTVAGFGKGLLKTGKGLVTGNLKEAGKGISEATVGTVKNATDTVNKTAQSAAGGVSNAYDSTTGSSKQTDWRKSNSARHAEFEKGAQEWLENSTFPPTTTKKEKASPTAPNPPVEAQQTPQPKTKISPTEKDGAKEKSNETGGMEPSGAPESKEEAAPKALDSSAKEGGDDPTK